MLHGCDAGCAVLAVEDEISRWRWRSSKFESSHLTAHLLRSQLWQSPLDSPANHVRVLAQALDFGLWTRSPLPNTFSSVLALTSRFGEPSRALHVSEPLCCRRGLACLACLPGKTPWAKQTPQNTLGRSTPGGQPFKRLLWFSVHCVRIRNFIIRQLTNKKCTQKSNQK
jgi:hypothetical protein